MSSDSFTGRLRPMLCWCKGMSPVAQELDDVSVAHVCCSMEGRG